MESLLPAEALEDDFKNFDSAVRVLTLRDYDYLDFRNEGFDKDYVEFLSRMDSLTDKLQNKLETTYDGVWDTPHAFQYLPRYVFINILISTLCVYVCRYLLSPPQATPSHQIFIKFRFPEST